MKRTAQNGDRARCAAQALRAYNIATGDGEHDESIRDLIADLGHYADRHDMEFLDLVARAIGSWALEQKDPESCEALPLVTIHIGEGAQP
jgi:hypothetical protein